MMKRSASSIPLVSSVTQHVCSLPIKDTSGLPKLPPNASWLAKTLRSLRKCMLLNPNNIRVKKLFRNKSSMMAERKNHARGPNCYVFHPLSLFSTIIEAMFCITWIVCLIFDPMMIYVDEVHAVYHLIQCYIVFVFRFTVLIMFFNVGYVDQRTNTCVVDRKKIVCKYLKSYFVFDFISIMLMKVAEILTNQGDFMKCTWKYRYEDDCHGYLYLIRILCTCVRINKLFESIDEVLANMNISHRMRFTIIYVIKTYIYLHLLAFLIYFIPYLEFNKDWPKDSWLTQASKNQNWAYRSHFQYCESLVVASCYFFGIEYRFKIDNFKEQICISIISFLGRIYTLYLMADILNVFGIVGISESMYEAQLVSLEQYMSEKNLPIHLRSRMLHYYQFKFQGHYFRETEILASLSDHLRTELFIFKARKLIKKVEFFKKLPSTTMGEIIGAMKSETFSAKDVIIKIGSHSDDIYFISTGTVAIINMQGAELCHLEDGEEFGTTCIVMKEHLFAVVAVETTEVFYIHKNQFLELISPHSEVMIMFHNSVKAKLLKYKELGEHAMLGRVDILTELKEGNILEGRDKKFIAR